MSKTPAQDNQEESKPFSPLSKKHMSTKEHLIKPEVHLGHDRECEGVEKVSCAKSFQPYNEQELLERQIRHEGIICWSCQPKYTG